MAKIVPIKGKFESVRALLARVMEDADDLESLVIVAYGHEGTVSYGQVNMTLEGMSFAGTLLQAKIIDALSE